MKILAVDDDALILELLGEFMVAIGDHELTTAQSGDEALELITGGFEPDCFLLDIQMPRMDGIQLCSAIRALPNHSRTPILMLTAMSEKRYIDGAFAAGATDYVTKPFEFNELRARVGLVEGLVSERRKLTDKIFAVQAMRSAGREAPPGAAPGLNEPFRIEDVDGVIECMALENYLKQLSRSSLFGSTVFGLSIRRIDKLYERCSSFDFRCVVTDVAEAISDTLQEHQFLMTYSGNGTFVVVTEGGWRPNMQEVLDRLHFGLRQMDLHTGDGRPIDLRLAAGKPVRLIWRSGQTAIDAVSEAQVSAEEEAAQVEKKLDGLWFMEQTA